MSFIISSFKNFLLENNWLLHALSGLLLGLCVPGIGVWPLAWIGFVPALIALTRCKNTLMAFLHGTLMGVIYNVLLFQWFWGLKPLTWIGFSEDIALLVVTSAWLLVVGLQALIIGIIWAGVFQSYKRYGEAGLLLLPLFWVLGLWFLNQQPLGLPWGFLTYSQAGVPLIREGSYVVTFWGIEELLVFANVLVALALIKRRWQPLVVGVLSVAGLCFFVWRLPPLPKDPLATLEPVIIQGNLSIEQERHGFSAQDRQSHYQRLIYQAVSLTDSKTRLIVLPEGATVFGIVPFKTPPSTAVLAGGLIETSQGWYNGALLYSPGAKQLHWVAKRYLVPFGETTPIVSDVWLKEVLKPYGVNYNLGFASGVLNQRPLEFEGLKIGSLICFEALYPNLTWRYQRQQVGLLATFSNLGWYHQNPMLEKQFLAINRFRAAETRLPLILATNTGVSAFIAADGEVVSASQSGKKQILMYKTPVYVPSLPAN